MVKILLDSASDGIATHPFDYFLPLIVDFGDKVYHDGTDLKPQKFYRLLTSTGIFPKTSQPSPEVLAAIFEEVKRNNDELIYLCLSSSLSGTFQSANIAKDMVEYEGIHIVDTRGVSHMIGLLARYADDLRKGGLGVTEIIKKINRLREKQVLYAGLQTLEYLHKGGRLSRSSAAIGTAANIKPIITVSAEGKVVSLAKAIGVKRSIANIVKYVREHEIDTDFPIWSLCTVDNRNCDALENAMAQSGFPVTQRMQVGPTIGSHVGPGVYGILFVSK